MATSRPPPTSPDKPSALDLIASLRPATRSLWCCRKKAWPMRSAGIRLNYPSALFARYSKERFRDQWHLSPEQSLLLHAGHTGIPKQAVICSPKGTNNTVNLPYGTSIYDLKQAEIPPMDDVEDFDGLRVFSAAAALLKVPDNFYQRYPIEAQVILARVRDPSDLLRKLLAGGHSPYERGRNPASSHNGELPPVLFSPKFGETHHFDRRARSELSERLVKHRDTGASRQT